MSGERRIWTSCGRCAGGGDDRREGSPGSDDWQDWPEFQIESSAVVPVLVSAAADSRPWFPRDVARPLRLQTLNLEAQNLLTSRGFSALVGVHCAPFSRSAFFGSSDARFERRTRTPLTSCAEVSLDCGRPCRRRRPHPEPEEGLGGERGRSVLIEPLAGLGGGALLLLPRGWRSCSLVSSTTRRTA